MLQEELGDGSAPAGELMRAAGLRVLADHPKLAGELARLQIPGGELAGQ